MPAECFNRVALARNGAVVTLSLDFEDERAARLGFEVMALHLRDGYLLVEVVPRADALTIKDG